LNFNLSIIDGHVDTAIAIQKQERNFWELSDKGHCDYTRMKIGGINAALLAVCPVDTQENLLSGLDTWFKFVNQPQHRLYQVTKVEDFSKLKNMDKIGVVLHFEGAGGIDEDLKLLRISYELGLRTLGITHAEQNKFGTGAPYLGPQPAQIKGGLSDKGFELIKHAQNLGMTIDVSHLNDKSFWDVMECTKRPVMASHSNCRTICPSPRNLSDDMICAIHKNKGVIGICFEKSFLDTDMNHKNYGLSMSVIKQHIDHIIDIADDNTISIGTDFDGCGAPDCVKDASYLPEFLNYLNNNQTFPGPLEYHKTTIQH